MSSEQASLGVQGDGCTSRRSENIPIVTHADLIASVFPFLTPATMQFDQLFCPRNEHVTVRILIMKMIEISNSKMLYLQPTEQNAQFVLAYIFVCAQSGETAHSFWAGKLLIQQELYRKRAGGVTDVCRCMYNRFLHFVSLDVLMLILQIQSPHTSI